MALNSITFVVPPPPQATKGYFSGGNTGALSNITNGLTFSSDTSTMVTKGALTQITMSMGAANSTTVGYFSGGATITGYTTGLSTTNGLTFSSDTSTMVTKGALTLARHALAAANSTTIGYYSGGKSTSGGGPS